MPIIPEARLAFVDRHGSCSLCNLITTKKAHADGAMLLPDMLGASQWCTTDISVYLQTLPEETIEHTAAVTRPASWAKASLGRPDKLTQLRSPAIDQVRSASQQTQHSHATVNNCQSAHKPSHI
jgi:hypothetical protein